MVTNPEMQVLGLEAEPTIGVRDYIGEGNRLVKANTLTYTIGDISTIYDASYADGTPAIIKVLKPKDHKITTPIGINQPIDRFSAQQLLENEYTILRKLTDAGITHIPIPGYLHIFGQDNDKKAAPYLTMSKPKGEALDKAETLDEESVLKASRQFVETINQAIDQGVLYNQHPNLKTLVWDSVTKNLTITDWQNAVSVEQQALVSQAVSVLQVITLLCQKFPTDLTTLQTSELKNFFSLKEQLSQGTLQLEANQILQIIQRVLDGEQVETSPALDHSHELATSEKTLTEEKQRVLERIGSLPKDEFDKLLVFARANRERRLQKEMAKSDGTLIEGVNSDPVIFDKVSSDISRQPDHGNLPFAKPSDPTRIVVDQVIDSGSRLEVDFQPETLERVINTLQVVANEYATQIPISSIAEIIAEARVLQEKKTKPKDLGINADDITETMMFIRMYADRFKGMMSHDGSLLEEILKEQQLVAWTRDPESFQRRLRNIIPTEPQS